MDEERDFEYSDAEAEEIAIQYGFVLFQDDDEVGLIDEFYE